MNVLGLRVKTFAAAYFVPLVGVLLVLSLVGGGMTYTAYAVPSTTTEERVVSSWATTGSFTHTATVTENNSVFPVGHELSNRTVYFQRLSPVLEGTYEYRLEASESGSLSGTVSTGLVIRSVEERNGEVTELWRYDRSLDETPVTVSAGETVRVPYSVNVTAVANETQRINEELGDTLGRTNVTLLAVVDVRGTVNGEPVRHREQYAMPIAVEGNTYRVEAVGPVTDERESVETVTVETAPGPVGGVGGPLLLALSVVGLAGLVARKSRGTLTSSEGTRDYLDYRADRKEFDEWISTIELPEEALGRSRARAATLGDLVDFAIDTNNAVVEDPNDGVYYVVHGGYLYEYVPPTGGGRGGRAAEAPTDAERDPPFGADDGRGDTRGPDGSDERGTPGDD